MNRLHLSAAISAVVLAILLWQLVPEAEKRGVARTAPTTSSPGSQADNARRFVIRDVRVFDGERVIEHASVRVADGRIESIDEASGSALPSGYAVVEGSGHTLLPGLIDAHVHTWGEARRDALRFGVTTLLDQFSDHHALAAARAERESLEPTELADLYSAGTLATAAGGHGTQFGMAIPTLATPAEAGAWVAARKAEGSDWIKLVREDLAAYTTQRSLPTLDDATAAAVIEAAHAGGLRALAHASTRAMAFASLRDGADGLVHVFQDMPADAELVSMARARGAFVIPTLSVIAGMAKQGPALADDPRVQTLLSSDQRRTLGADFGFGSDGATLLQNALLSVQRLHHAGVPILAGTDAPNPRTAHGVSIHGELALLVRAGLTPLEALRAATSAPARAFALHDRGRVAAGLRADLVLVEGDPTLAIEAIRAIVAIWKNGSRVAREPARTAAATAIGAGRLSDFDDGRLDAALGTGWSETTDQIMGGRSAVRLEIASPGAQDSAGALRIAGLIASGASYPWAGAMYSPGSPPTSPVDGSALTELVFRTRGDGREYAVLLFSGEQMGIPAAQGFVAGPQWQEVRMPLAGFGGADLARLRAIAFSAGAPEGEFAFEIDAVELR